MSRRFSLSSTKKTVESAVSIGFYASLRAADAISPDKIEIGVYRSGMFPRDVWQELTRVRGDGKSIDAPLTMLQYTDMLAFLESVNTRSTAPVVDVEKVPDWVLTSISTARERDEEYDRKRSSPVISLASQSDEELRYLVDLGRLALIGPDRSKLVLPYQLEGAYFGLKRGGRFLIADEMGLGKTLQALMVAYQYRSEWPLLVVCPSSIRFVWREQINRWLGGLIDSRTDVHVVTKGKEVVNPSARIVIVPYVLLEPNAHLQTRSGSKLPYNCVICDESHYIKDPNSKRSKAVQSILKKAKRVILLSGTPSMNNAEEMYAQIVPLLPLAKKPSLTEFRNRYCVQSQFMVRGYPIVKWGGARNREELNALLVSSVMIRRMKADVLTQLPDKMRHRVELDVANSVFAKKVQDMTSGWLSKSESTSSAWGIQTMELWRLTGQAKLSAVKEYLTDLLSGPNSDFKMILFGHHKFMMDGLEELLVRTLPPGGYMRVDGGVGQAQRAGLVDQFQNDPGCRVALLSITSCSEGITLTAASIVIFCEMYWVPGLIEQAEARAHRVGQRDCVMCYYLVMPDSPDDVIFNLLEKKKKDTSVILDGTEEGLINNKSTPMSTPSELLDVADFLDDDRLWVPAPGEVRLSLDPLPDPKRQKL